MKKTIFTMVVMLFLAAASVLAADGLSVSSLPGTVVADPGDSVLDDFVLSNTGTTDLNINVQPIIMSDGSFSFTSLVGVPETSNGFLSGTSQTVNITGSIPGNQYASTYTGRVNVTGGATSAAFTLTVIVNQELSMSANSISLSALQGASKSGTLTVTNTGNKEATVTVIANNLRKVGDNSKLIPAGSINIADSSLTPGYGGVDSTDITVNVPSNTEVGTYTGNLTLSFGSQTVSAPLTVDVSAPTSGITTSVSSVDVTERPGDTFQTTFTVQNTGTTDLIGLQITIATPTGFTAVNATPSLFNLDAGATRTIIVQGEIPQDIDTTSNPYDGTLTIANTQVSQVLPLELNGQVMFELKRVDVYVGGRRDRVDEGDTVDQIEPGDTIRIRMEFENLWPDRNDLDFDIENIDTTLTISDIDDGDDIEEDIDVDDIKADDTEVVEFEFEVPYNVDEDTFDVLIESNADDENDAEYELEFNFELEVEKERDAIKITEADLDRSQVTCDRTVRLFAEVANIGSDLQRNVVLEVKSSALGILEQETTIQLDDDPDDDDNSYSRNFILEIPSNKRAGTYSISVNAYLDRTNLDDSELVDLIVADCGDDVPDEPEEEDQQPEDQQKPQPEEEDKGEDVVVQPIVTPPTGGVVVQPPKEESKFTDSTAYVVLLAVLVVLVLVGIVIMTTMLLRKPRI